MKWAVLGGFALAIVVLAEDGWIEWIALAELAFLLVILGVTKHWSDVNAETHGDLVDAALTSLEEHRAYGQRVTDLNERAIRALAEHDRELAAVIAGDFLDAYSLYRERIPDGPDGEPTYLDDPR